MKEEKEFYHYSIWIVIVFLCAYGAVMVYSASAATCLSEKQYNYDSMYLLKRQLIFMAAGLIACMVLPKLPYRLLDRYAVLVYIMGGVCIALLKTKFGISVNGATRWLRFGPVQFQVAEVVKICVIIMMASMLQHNKSNLKSWKTAAWMWIVCGMLVGPLYIISNDLSSSIVILGIAFGLSFIFTKTFKFHIAVLASALVGAGAYVFSIARDLPTPEEMEKLPFRIARIAAWIDPERYASGKGYQTLQSLYAIGRGGFTGQGLGNSMQKISAIPEAQNDMIFSIICEELGVVGVVVLLILFIILLYSMVQIAKKIQDRFDCAVVIGVFLHIGIQTIFNIAVNTNVMPNTGLPLPFISYGGTAVACQLCEVALVLAIDSKNREIRLKKQRGLL